LPYENTLLINKCIFSIPYTVQYLNRSFLNLIYVLFFKTLIPEVGHQPPKDVTYNEGDNDEGKSFN